MREIEIFVPQPGEIAVVQRVFLISFGNGVQFQQWVDAARNVNEDIKIALKADASTPYKTVKRVMNELQDMDESHYYMITQLKQQGDE